MDFRITIEDQALLDGITWARNQYNAGPPPDGMLMADDNEYVVYIVTAAAASYAQQSGRAVLTSEDADGKVTDAIAAAKSGDLTKLDALRAEYEGGGKIAGNVVVAETKPAARLDTSGGRSKG